MAELIANDVIRFTMLGTLSGKGVATVIDMKANRPIDNGNSESNCERVRDAWQDHILDQLTTNYTFTGATYLDMDSLVGDSGSMPPNAAKPVVGQESGSAQAPQVCWNIKKRLRSGAPRGLSGRWFLPGIGEGSVGNDGLVSSARVTAMNDTLEDFLAAINENYEDPGIDFDNGIYMCVTSFPRDDEGEINGPGVGHFVDSLVCQSRVSTLRRRNRPA